MTKKIILFVVVIIVFALAILVFLSSKIKVSKNDSIPRESRLVYEGKVKINEKEILVEIAETNLEKARGLSGKTNLTSNEGMLFVFPNNTQPSFWMKDMLMPLDLIWIADGKIVHIHKNVPPPTRGQTDTDLPLYRPPQPINYVLEVNGGFSDAFGVKAGDGVEINF